MPIPKSLHTLRVLTTMARIIEADTHEAAVEEAARELGYGTTDDDYGLKAKAVRQLEAEDEAA